METEAEARPDVNLTRSDMTSQLELERERVELRNELAQAIPAMMSHVAGGTGEAYKDGALSAKVKRLMALAIALRAGCTNCILAQTQLALQAGATKEEVLETIAVEVSMSGTTGVAESLRVVKLLKELGEW